jgi:hypothetical protein
LSSHMVIPRQTPPLSNHSPLATRTSSLPPFVDEIPTLWVMVVLMKL